MRSTTERMKLLEKRALELKRRRSEKKHMLAVALCGSFCIALIAAVSAVVCDLNFDGFRQAAQSGTASIFAGKAFMGYAVVGVLSFLLGISVTLMCNILHNRKKAGDGENDRDNG